MTTAATGAEECLSCPSSPWTVWTGTMCLTEAHCGTDLGPLKTRRRAARRRQLSHHRHQDLHLRRRARFHRQHRASRAGAAAGCAEGIKGISAVHRAEVPRQRDGSAGRTQSACVRFHRAQDGHQGVRHLRDEFRRRHRLAGRRAEQGPAGDVHHDEFRAARHRIPGVCHAENAFQDALAYARERLEMRSLSGPKFPDDPANPIVHRDVRRMC